MAKVWKVWGYKSEYTYAHPLYVREETAYKALEKAREVDPDMVAVQMFDPKRETIPDDCLPIL